KTFERVAEAIAQNTPEKIGVPARYITDAQQVMTVNFTLVEMESDDDWMRDTGPTILLNQAGERRVIYWQFNAWGG
ncbi:agmatine deiminase family protein, partial [Pectobacterium brasiliense]|uniref:agmatine deiminase family protein n=1 Tax=Pectobacterium brasiliense TaxID=180957 RepID=UPI001968B723